jgi:NAD(P)-dependent dehydrogenase (short-subunit alcohol dehydrogenase family)
VTDITLRPNLYPPPISYQGRRLEGKVVIIFGASSGIGAAAATRFAAEGAAVAVAARRADRLDELVAAIRGAGGRATALPCDVRAEGDIARAVNDTVSRCGRLDGAFNNAGVSGTAQPIHNLSASSFDELIAVNLRAVALCLKHEVCAMRGHGGSIVNTSSIGSLTSNAALPDYGASKAAVNHLTRSAAVGYARDGIRVNAIAPGATSSEMLDPWITDPADRTRWASSPIPFIALPDDMARVALFLLSDEARWITGHILPVDGGTAAA